LGYSAKRRRRKRTMRRKIKDEKYLEKAKEEETKANKDDG
jgi:hypothetical protein